MKTYLSTYELAERLNCSQPTILRLIAQGVLAGHRFGCRKYWVEVKEAEAYIAKVKAIAEAKAEHARRMRANQLELWQHLKGSD